VRRDYRWGVIAAAAGAAGNRISNRISKSERTFAADEPSAVAKSAFILPIATGDWPKSSSQASLSCSWLKTSSWLKDQRGLLFEAAVRLALLLNRGDELAILQFDTIRRHIALGTSILLALYGMPLGLYAWFLTAD
jgi:hypothetical protein